MSNPRIYVNTFEHYTSSFYVWEDGTRECVLRWNNISPLEIVIPYTEELVPEKITKSLQRILERTEDIPYEDYPFRMKPIVGITASPTIYEIFWAPLCEDNEDISKRPRVRVVSGGERRIAIDVGISSLFNSIELMEQNIHELLRTLHY